MVMLMKTSRDWKDSGMKECKFMPPKQSVFMTFFSLYKIVKEKLLMDRICMPGFNLRMYAIHTQIDLYYY